MNILPLITSFLMILAFLAASLANRTSDFQHNALTTMGFMKAEHALRNEIQKHSYETMYVEIKNSAEPEEENTKDQGPKKERKPKHFSKSHRENKHIDPRSRVNLLLLFEDLPSKNHQFLYEACASLIRELYKKTSFFKSIERLEYRLLDELISTAKDHPNPLALTDLFPKDSSLSEAFYQMLKGTPYDLQETGFPPLDEVFTLERDKKNKALNLAYASKVTLCAFFGEKLAEDLIQKELEKATAANSFSFLSFEEIKSILLTKTQTAFDGTDIEQLCYNETRAKKKQEPMLGKDDKTGIQLKKMIPSEEYTPST
ncbi:MAG: hypothetical protein ACM3JI_02385 [Anaerolineae bacterium]